MAYDIHFQPVPASEVKGYKCFEFGFRAALKVTGFQSLVNRWVKTFMTPRGSNPLYPDEGTGFGRLVGSNISKISTDLQDVVAMAVEDANEQVRDQDIVGLRSDNERLASATLLDFVRTDDGIQVWVLIKNMEGSSLAVPVATLGAEQ